MFEEKKIAFIGPGEMAEAMIHGLIRRQVAEPEALLAAGPRQERLDQLNNKYHIQAFIDNAEAAAPGGCSCPLGETAASGPGPSWVERCDPPLGACALYCGRRIYREDHRGLGHSLVVRSMPNTPAQIGEGITVWTASKRCNRRTDGDDTQHPGRAGR